MYYCCKLLKYLKGFSIWKYSLEFCHWIEKIFQFNEKKMEKDLRLPSMINIGNIFISFEYWNIIFDYKN